MKIHIIGGAGSGKTYISKILSEKLNIVTYDLDNVQFNNDFRIRRSDEERNQILNGIVNKESWIIEGCYHLWVDKSFENSDYIFYIVPKLRIRIYRIIKRFIKRKIGISDYKKENIKSVFLLIKSYLQRDKKEKLETLEKLKKYNNKVYMVKNNLEILKILRIDS